MMYLFVAKNEAGVESHYYGKNDRENLIQYELSEDEYYTLWKHHVFDILNDKFDLWIDNGESETVTADQLKAAYQEISQIKGTWLDAVNKAIEYGTCVFLDL